MKMDDDMLKIYAVKDSDGLVRTLYYAGSNMSAWNTFKQLTFNAEEEDENFTLWYFGHFDTMRLIVVNDDVKEIKEEPR